MSPQINRLNSHIGCICEICLQSEFSYASCILYTVYFNRCIVAFVWFFSSVYFQVFYQASFIFGFKVTLLTLKIPLHVSQEEVFIMVSNNLLHIMFSDNTKNFHFSQPFFSVRAVCSLPWPLPAPQISPSPPRPALWGGRRSRPCPIDFCPYLSPPRPVKKIASRSIPGGDNTSSWNCSSCRSSLSSPSSSS